jgi:hypothetical protein
VKKILAVGAMSLLGTSAAYAGSYTFTGTFDSWIALSPGTTTDSNGDGTLDCTASAPCTGLFSGSNSLGTVVGAATTDVASNGGFAVSGSVTFAGVATAGSVTSLVINQVGTANSQTGAPGIVTLTTSGLQWTWSASGGPTATDSLRQTGGSASCTGTSPSNSGCVNTAPAISANSDSVWDWDGISAAFRVQGGAIDPVDTEAFAHSISGLTMTVNTGSRTLYQASNTGLFNTANRGQYTLALTEVAEVPAPAASLLFASGLGMLGTWMKRRKSA